MTVKRLLSSDGSSIRSIIAAIVFAYMEGQTKF